MAFVALYWTFLCFTAALAASRGGPPVRLFVSILVVCAIASAPLAKIEPPLAAQIALLIVDAALLMTAATIAIFSNVFWPLWIAGMQLAAVITRLSAFFVAQDRFWILDTLAGFYAIPCLLLLLLGVLKDARSDRGAALP